VLSAPDVFDQNEEDGIVILLAENPSDDLTDNVEEAAALCPGRASDGEVVADIPNFTDARAAGCPFDPAPRLQQLQAEAPITKVRLWDGSTPWLVTRYDDQRALFVTLGSARTAPIRIFPR